MTQVEIYFLEAIKAVDKDELGLAKNLLEDILLIDPGYGRAHNYLGWIYETKIKDFEKSELHYNLAIKFCEGNFPIVYINYAYLLIEFGHLDKAEKIISEGLMVRGADKATLFYQKGKIAEHRLKFKHSLKLYTQAQKLCFNRDFFAFLNSEIERVKSKMSFWQKLF